MDQTRSTGDQPSVPVTLFCVEGDAMAKTIQLPSTVQKMVLNCNGELYFCAHTDGSLTIVDAKTGSLVHSIELCEQQQEDRGARGLSPEDMVLAADPSVPYLFYYAWGADMFVFNATEANMVGSVLSKEPEKSRVTAVGKGGVGGKLVLCFSNGSCITFQTGIVFEPNVRPTIDPIQWFIGSEKEREEGEYATCCCFGPDGNIVCFGTNQGRIVFKDLKGRLPDTDRHLVLSGPVTDVDSSLNLVSATSSCGELFLMDTQETCSYKTMKLTKHALNKVKIVESKKGLCDSTVLCGDAKGNVLVFSSKDEIVVAAYQDPDCAEPVTGLAYWADQGSFAFSCGDNVRIADLKLDKAGPMVSAESVAGGQIVSTGALLPSENIEYVDFNEDELSEAISLSLEGSDPKDPEKQLIEAAISLPYLEEKARTMRLAFEPSATCATANYFFNIGACGLADGRVLYWALQQPGALGDLQVSMSGDRFKGPVNAVCPLSKNRIATTNGANVSIWDLEKKTVRNNAIGTTSKVTCMTSCNAAESLVVGCASGELLMAVVAGQQTVHHKSFEPPLPSSCVCLAVGWNSCWLVAGAKDGSLFAYSTGTFRKCSIDMSSDAIPSAAMRSQMRSYCVVGYEDGSVRVWDLEVGLMAVVRMANETSPITCLKTVFDSTTYSNASRLSNVKPKFAESPLNSIVAGTKDGRLLVWPWYRGKEQVARNEMFVELAIDDAEEGRPRCEIRAIDTNGRQVVALDGSGRMVQLRASGEPILKGTVERDVKFVVGSETEEEESEQSVPVFGYGLKHVSSVLDADADEGFQLGTRDEFAPSSLAGSVIPSMKGRVRSATVCLGPGRIMSPVAVFDYCKVQMYSVLTECTIDTIDVSFSAWGKVIDVSGSECGEYLAVVCEKASALYKTASLEGFKYLGCAEYEEGSIKRIHASCLSRNGAELMVSSDRCLMVWSMRDSYTLLGKYKLTSPINCMVLGRSAVYCGLDDGYVITVTNATTSATVSGAGNSCYLDENCCLAGVCGEPVTCIDLHQHNDNVSEVLVGTAKGNVFNYLVLHDGNGETTRANTFTLGLNDSIKSISVCKGEDIFVASDSTGIYLCCFRTGKVIGCICSQSSTLTSYWALKLWRHSFPTVSCWLIAFGNNHNVSLFNMDVVNLALNPSSRTKENVQEYMSRYNLTPSDTKKGGAAAQKEDFESRPFLAARIQTPGVVQSIAIYMRPEEEGEEEADTVHSEVETFTDDAEDESEENAPYISTIAISCKGLCGVQFYDLLATGIRLSSSCETKHEVHALDAAHNFFESKSLVSVSKNGTVTLWSCMDEAPHKNLLEGVEGCIAACAQMTLADKGAAIVFTKTDEQSLHIVCEETEDCMAALQVGIMIHTLVRHPLQKGCVVLAGISRGESPKFVVQVLDLEMRCLLSEIDLVLPDLSESVTCSTAAEKFACLGLSTGDLVLVDLLESKVLHKACAHVGPVHCVAFADNSNKRSKKCSDRIFSSGQETIIVSCSKRLCTLLRIKCHSPVQALRVNFQRTHGYALICGDQDKYLYVYAVPNGAFTETTRTFIQNVSREPWFCDLEQEAEVKATIATKILAGHRPKTLLPSY